MVMLVLYHDHRSYASQKVQVYLSEKRIQWQSHLIDLLKQENILDETYQKINPRGTVPTLKDGEIIICNSTEIMEYVSQKYLPQSDVFFNQNLSKTVHDFCKADELLHDPHIRILTYSSLWMAGEKTAEEKNRLIALAAKHPDTNRGEFLKKAVMRKFTPEEIKQAHAEIIHALSDMEQKLEASQSDFIFGQEYTMADAVCTVRLFRFGRLNIKIECLKDQYPRTADFYERAKRRPSFCEIKI